MENDQQAPKPKHSDDPVEETVHAGCGLPLLVGLVALFALLNAQ